MRSSVHSALTLALFIAVTSSGADGAMRFPSSLWGFLTGSSSDCSSDLQSSRKATAVGREVAFAFLDSSSDKGFRVERRPAFTGALSGVESEFQAGDAVAFGEYVPHWETASNFGKLRIQTSPRASDEQQTRAMGFLEGYLTAVPIHQHWLNMQSLFHQSTNHTVEILAWLVKHREWWRQQVEQHANTDDYSAMLRFIWQQVEGIVEGYNAKLSDDPRLAERGLKPLSFDDLLLLNSFGDMDDLLVMADAGYLAPPPKRRERAGQRMATAAAAGVAAGGGPMEGAMGAAAAGEEGRGEEEEQEEQEGGRHKVVLHPQWQTLTPAEARRAIATGGHCSALIKVTSDLSDILMGHTTWWSYSSLLRLYKYYITSLSHPAVAAQRISFSSYPGMVHSMDDFMISSSGLVILETSNDVFDLTLYQHSTSQAALSWQRFRASTMLARDGAVWAKGIATYNSGTYVNQYCVVDLNRFKPGQQLAPGLLTVVETVPGGAFVADTTQELERGYWPSYNIPYFQDVYNKTGVPDLQAALRARGKEFHEVADGLSYQVAPRAKIFRRDAGNVNSLHDLKRLLRSDGWTPTGRHSDPFSPTVWDAICARGDLDPKDGDAYGCYDAKVTSYRLALEMTAEAINGPAWDGDGSRNGKAPFSWSSARWKGVAHEGMINTYDTVFERMEP